MSARSIASPENQSATFIELFFDLVFVFSVTQVVSLLHGGLTLEAVGQAVLVFWMVWWAWTQFTWSLNAADTTHPWVEIGTLAGTAVAFFMAVALPDAFRGQALVFAVPYVLVRVIGLVLYIWVASENPALRAAVRNFALLSIGGLVMALIGAAVGGSLQYVLWGIAILLDIIAAMIGGQSEDWNLHPEHFSERHGLFVIIALGETLIVAAAGLTGAAWTGDLIAVAVLAVAVTCGLWWSYFARAKPIMDHAMEVLHGSAQSMLARDAYSLMHFPMLCGIIAYAVAIEEMVAHPAEPLHLDGQLALAAGVLLFVGGLALALWRGTQRLFLPRILLTLLTVIAVVAVSGVAPALSLGIVLVGLVIMALIEQRSQSMILDTQPE